MEQDIGHDMGRFLQRIRSKALAFAVVRLRDEDNALDIVQDTMMGFVKSAPRYAAEAWTNLFYKILTRRITDWQRKQSWRNRLFPILSFPQHADPEDGPDDFPSDAGHPASNAVESAYNADILSAQFERALQALPPRQQEAYLLRQWQGLSVQETADIMGCSQGSVKTHLSRALHALKTQLGEWLDG